MHDKEGEKRGEGFVEGKEKVEMGRQRAGGLRVPLLAEVFSSMK